MEDIEKDKIPYEQYIIHRMLTKTLNKYKSMNSQPHALVAKRLIQNGFKTE